MGEPMPRVRTARRIVVEGFENDLAVGLRERKKARLRQQIIDTSIKLFRKRGFENTRIDDIVQVLEISQPTFFRYFRARTRFCARSANADLPVYEPGCARSCLAMRAQ